MGNYIHKFSVVQTENGPRQVQVGRYNGSKFKVVTGYDVINDRFPVHVYLTPPNGEEFKFPSDDIFGDSVEDAFRRGFLMLEGWFENPIVRSS